MKIANVHGRQIVDCKCRPLVEVEITCDDGTVVRGAAPTGQSVGIHESYVLRDGDPNDYHGLSVHKAVANVDNEIKPLLVGKDVDDPKALDRALIELDGTPDKHRLGGNTVYSTSIALWRAYAAAHKKPLYQMIAGKPLSTVPVPTFNMVNGGVYDTLTQPFNEFIVVPWGAETIQEAIAISIDLFNHMEDTLRRYLGTTPAVARSYGYAAPSDDPAVVLSLMRKAMEELGYQDKFCFAFDCASSEMYDKESRTYLLKGERVTSEQLVDYMVELSREFNFLFIEDLLDEDDWEGFALAKKKLTHTIIIGDDLIVTNRARLEKAVSMDAVGGFVLKPNQIGTLTEAFDTYEYAQEHGLIALPSGRSGGVIDDVVMDLSVGLQVPFQKNGAPRSGERIEKLNFLIRASESAPDVKLSDLKSVVRF